MTITRLATHTAPAGTGVNSEFGVTIDVCKARENIAASSFLNMRSRLRVNIDSGQAGPRNKTKRAAGCARITHLPPA